MEKDNKTKEQYWLGQMEQWEKSGLSQRAYCDREGLGFPAFDYWRRQKRKMEKSEASEKRRKISVTLVPLQVASVATSQSAKMILRNPAVWELELPATIEAQWLASLLKGLT